jgi:hypothetical protein
MACGRKEKVKTPSSAEPYLSTLRNICNSALPSRGMISYSPVSVNALNSCGCDINTCFNFLLCTSCSPFPSTESGWSNSDTDYTLMLKQLERLLRRWVLDVHSVWSWGKYCESILFIRCYIVRKVRWSPSPSLEKRYLSFPHKPKQLF